MEIYFPPFYNIREMKQIKNLAYIHDLGGTKTMNGEVIKSHLLYRSAHLAEIDEKAVDRLADELNIKHIVDLRTDEELNYRPEDFVSRRIEYHHVPLLDEEINPVVTKENRVQVLNDLIAGEGGMIGHILSLYGKVVTSDMSIAGYKEIFRLLLECDPNDGFLFHCTQGKDRTGITIMLILTALGVSRDRITNIYLSFNNRARLKRTAYFLGMNIVFSLKQAIALNNTLIARKIYINKAYDTINQFYGGVEKYIRDIIGLSDSDIQKLKNKFLTA